MASVERRRAPHRVDHVLVETGKEAKAVFTGQAMLDRLYAGIGPLVAARAGAVVDHRDAARLAAGDVAELEHDHLEAAFDQLVRRAHARHAAAENDHPGRHASPSLRYLSAHGSYRVGARPQSALLGRPPLDFGIACITARLWRLRGTCGTCGTCGARAARAACVTRAARGPRGGTSPTIAFRSLMRRATFSYTRKRKYGPSICGHPGRSPARIRATCPWRRQARSARRRAPPPRRSPKEASTNGATDRRQGMGLFGPAARMTVRCDRRGR